MQIHETQDGGNLLADYLRTGAITAVKPNEFVLVAIQAGRVVKCTHCEDH